MTGTASRTKSGSSSRAYAPPGAATASARLVSAMVRSEQPAAPPAPSKTAKHQVLCERIRRRMLRSRSYELRPTAVNHLLTSAMTTSPHPAEHAEASGAKDSLLDRA